jgi:hypothetical protein
MPDSSPEMNGTANVFAHRNFVVVDDVEESAAS